MKKIKYYIICFAALVSIFTAFFTFRHFSVNKTVQVSLEVTPTSQTSAETPTPTPITTPAATPTPVPTLTPTPTPELVPYKGVVEHIFFHPLLAYPEQAFDGDYQTLGYDDWFVTVDEYNKIVNSLYEKNFILVNINDVYEEYDSNGQMLFRKKDLMLPKGKKPLIISLDDVNYNKYMLGNGTVYKLILDDKGEITTYSINPKGEEVYSRDLESIPLLDQFVQKHPDFSLNGAKGTIALTGYEGILGYRTNRQSENLEAEQNNVKPIIEKLKKNGWNFACHSYGHPNISQTSLEKLMDDTTKWKNEVESLIGPTQVYIYPFGSSIPEGSTQFQYLQSQGFKLFCAVGIESYEKISTHTNAVMTDRRHMDGMGFRKLREKNLDLFDSNEIMDVNLRPKR